MRTTRQLSITLPNDMAEALRERVRSGEYASESEVIARACGHCSPAIRLLKPGFVTRLPPHTTPWSPTLRAPSLRRGCGRGWPPSRPGACESQRRLHARGGRSARRAVPLYRRRGSAEVAARYTEAIVAYCEELAAGQARHQLLVRSPPCRTHRKPTGYAVFLPDDLG